MKTKAYTKPSLVIAIAGPSSSGKTLLLNSLMGYFGTDYTTHFDMDGYHLHSRKERRILNEYPDEIRANDFDRVVRDIKKLRRGKSIEMPIYDHTVGCLKSTIPVNPNQILFIEGLHAGMLNDISKQDLLDLSIFLNPEKELRNSWKVKRDVLERGYHRREAIDQIFAREPFVQKYMTRQLNSSEIVLLLRQKQRNLVEQLVLISDTLMRKISIHLGNNSMLKKSLTFRPFFYNENEFYMIDYKYDESVFDSVNLSLKRFNISLSKNFKKSSPYYNGAADILFLLISLFLMRIN